MASATAGPSAAVKAAASAPIAPIRAPSEAATAPMADTSDTPMTMPRPRMIGVIRVRTRPTPSSLSVHESADSAALAIARPDLPISVDDVLQNRAQATLCASDPHARTSRDLLLEDLELLLQARLVRPLAVRHLLVVLVLADRAALVRQQLGVPQLLRVRPLGCLGLAFERGDDVLRVAAGVNGTLANRLVDPEPSLGDPRHRLVGLFQRLEQRLDALGVELRRHVLLVDGLQRREQRLGIGRRALGVLLQRVDLLACLREALLAVEGREDPQEDVLVGVRHRPLLPPLLLHEVSLGDRRRSCRLVVRARRQVLVDVLWGVDGDGDGDGVVTPVGEHPP